MRSLRPRNSRSRSAAIMALAGSMVLAMSAGPQLLLRVPPGPTAHAQAPVTGRLTEIHASSIVGAERTTPVDRLSFWAWRGTAWEPILWQHERWATTGPDDPPDTDMTYLEPGDRIVIALDDIGSRWPGTAWPEGIDGGTWPTEIEMRSGGPIPVAGSIYLFEAPVPPAALSLSPRIRWDEETGRVVSDHWSVGLKRTSRGGLFVDHVSLAGDGRDVVDSWARATYPEGGGWPPPELAEGIVAAPLISGPLRAIFSNEYRSEVMVSDRQALLRTTTGHRSDGDDRRQHVMLRLSTGPGATWRDDRRPGVAPASGAYGAGQPWPAWWDLSTPAGRLIGLTDSSAPCTDSELAVSVQDLESGLSVRLDARSLEGQHRYPEKRHWADLPHQLIALPAGEGPMPEQILSAYAFPVQVRLLGTQPDAPAPTPTATDTPDTPFDVTVRGHVRDATRADHPPLGGFRVAAIRCGQYCEAPVYTDETGAFEITCPDAGPFDPIEIRAWRADAGEWRVSPVLYWWSDDIEVLVDRTWIHLPAVWR